MASKDVILPHYVNLARNYILSGFSDTLYNVYSSAKTARAISDSLERKYNIEDVGFKKFIVGKFLEFKMVDSKTHKRKEMGLEDLIVRLTIEEDNRLSERNLESYKLRLRQI
ncbi:hypothetical protein Sango_2945400 [Sesamum angolense]|uniref:Uncharacterized protein n=1 Tax=Sesamum angolense TaxID=2727404 RepID=A0AAE1T3M6_9LAMI|nr:hypothetical protein Sango_2945400 [Sesamum angolense]